MGHAHSTQKNHLPRQKSPKNSSKKTMTKKPQPGPFFWTADQCRAGYLKTREASHNVASLSMLSMSKKNPGSTTRKTFVRVSDPKLTPSTQTLPTDTDPFPVPSVLFVPHERLRGWSYYPPASFCKNGSSIWMSVYRVPAKGS